MFIYSALKDDDFFKYYINYIHTCNKSIMFSRLVSKNENTVKELAGSLILPVIDVIVKAHTHAYMSKAVINNALELLVLMLGELPSYATLIG